MTRLLAAGLAASPSQLLVSAKPEGAAAEEVWIVSVDEQAILAHHSTTGLAGFSSQEEFFKQYAVPHCLPGGHRCLVVNVDEGASYLDVEPTRGEAQCLSRSSTPSTCSTPHGARQTASSMC